MQHVCPLSQGFEISSGHFPPVSDTDLAAGSPLTTGSAAPGSPLATADDLEFADLRLFSRQSLGDVAVMLVLHVW